MDPAPTGHRAPHVLYSIPLGALRLQVAPGVHLDVTDTLSSGRVNYAIFQKLVGLAAGLTPGTEGGGADLHGPNGQRYEVKAYFDPDTHPGEGVRVTRIHTAASSTFGPNNHGPRIKALLDAGDHQVALQICDEAGYRHNDFYVYTNTRGYQAGQPFRYLILPTATVRRILSADDPRIVNRRDLLNQVRATQTITLPDPGR